jgi:hypothetical protein
VATAATVQCAEFLMTFILPQSQLFIPLMLPVAPRGIMIALFLAEHLGRTRASPSRSSTLSSITHLPSRMYRIATRHLHVVVPLAAFALIFSAWSLAIQLALGSAFPPAFPASRSLFVSTLLTVPVWGLCMSVFYLVLFLKAPFWKPIKPWRHRPRQYTPISIPLEDIPSLSVEEGDGEYASTSWRHAKARGGAGTVGMSVVGIGYLTAVVFGLYLVCTYELPIDHRFKSPVQLANRIPRRQGYGTGGAPLLSSCRRDRC